MDLASRVWILSMAHDDPEKQAALYEKCRRDIVFWFNHFCWTFDPRVDKPDMPFVLYPFQEFMVREWLKNIDEQRDFGILKSRDVGASWMLILVFQYCWLFRKGDNFHVGSRKESEVDQAATDPAETLFGKFRYNLYKQPPWIRGEVSDKKLHIQNVANGNIITGESSNPWSGRGGRKRAILFDELSFWPDAEAAWQTCSQSTNCRIALSTPYGESNLYYRLITDPRNEKVEIPAEYLPKRGQEGGDNQSEGSESCRP